MPETATAPAVEFQYVDIDQVHESKTNPRKHFAKDALQDLTNSVREKGILVPLLVRPDRDGYETLAGARRLRAAKAAGLVNVPVLVRECDDETALEIQVIENLQRKDVHPLEEAEGYKQLLAKGKYDIEALADKVGKSTSYVYQRLKLAELVPAAKQAFEEEKITAGHAILLARLQPKDQVRALKDNRRQYGPTDFASVRELGRYIQEEIHLELKGVPWDVDDDTLVPAAGSCKACPKRTGANAALFADIKAKDSCTDPQCFSEKMRAQFVKLQAEIEGKGGELVQVSCAYDSKVGIKRDNWKLAAAGSCPNTASGFVIEGGWNDKELKRGQLVGICNNKQCRVHWQSYESGYSSRSGVDKAKERKTKALEAARTEALRQIAAKLKTWNLTAAAVRFAHHIPFDAQKLACKVLGVWPKDGKVGGFDFREKLKAHIGTIRTPLDLHRVYAVLSLVPGYGRWGDGYYSSSELPALRDAGKKVGVNVKAIETKFVADARAKAKKKTKGKAKAKQAPKPKTPAKNKKAA